MECRNKLVYSPTVIDKQIYGWMEELLLIDNNY